MRNGGPLETGLDRVVVGGAVLCFAPLVVIAAFPVPAVVGTLMVVTGVMLMLRAPASDEHQQLLRAIGIAVAAALGLTALALIVPDTTVAGVLTVLATATGTAAFVFNGYAMRELCRRGLGHGGLGRRWRNATMLVARAAVANVVAIAVAFALGDIAVRGHQYVFDRHSVAGLAYLATVVVFIATVVRLTTLVAHTRYTLRVHFENEPLRRLRRPDLRRLPGHHPGN